MTGPVIVNADDYAMDEGVDAAILDLGRRGVVTATSAMVLSPAWPEAAGRLKDAPLSRGLHLDFTSPFTGGEFARQSITGMTIRTHAGAVDKTKARREIHRQLSLFEAGMKAPPDFVDGHQHAHHLPGVAEALVAALGERYGAEAGRIGLRICVSRRWRGMKAFIIGRTGAFRLAALAAGPGHATNTDFAGVYDFNEDAKLDALWEGWLSSVEGGAPLVMCHVAERGDHDGGDPIRGARYREYDWLRSEAFTKLFSQRFSKTPGRWPQA
jgi:chitin disaccharide deacetylase